MQARSDKPRPTKAERRKRAFFASKEGQKRLAFNRQRADWTRLDLF